MEVGDTQQCEGLKINRLGQHGGKKAGDALVLPPVTNTANIARCSGKGLSGRECPQRADCRGVAETDVDVWVVSPNRVLLLIVKGVLQLHNILRGNNDAACVSIRKHTRAHDQQGGGGEREILLTGVPSDVGETDSTNTTNTSTKTSVL